MNAYPNDGNYPVPSFDQPVQSPDVDPDAGDLVSASFNADWIPAMEGALSALILPSTWAGTPDEIKLAISRAITLRSLIGQADVLVNNVEAPYWDDVEDADDVLPPEEQPWYGAYIDETFQATIENWAIAAFVMASVGPAPALAFLTLAPRFRLAFKSHDLGGIIRVIVDAVEVGRVDTAAGAPGILTFDVVADPDEDEHQIYLVLDEPEFMALNAPGDPATSPMQVIRKLLNADEISPGNLRYDATCDCIQQTYDGGSTWVDQPGADPRHADVFRLPASTSPDAACDAAARIVGAWQENLSLLYQTTNAAQFGTGILNALLLLSGGAGILLELVFLALEGLITIGVSTIEAAFTGDVWSGIECIIYCHVDPDGQMSAAQAADIMADIATAYPGTVYNTLVQLVNLYGEVLMSNAGVERTETGNCDDCSCDWCAVLNFRTGTWSYTIIPPYGTWTANGLESSTFFGTTQAAYIQWTIGSDNAFNIYRAELDVTYPGGTTNYLNFETVAGVNNERVPVTGDSTEVFEWEFGTTLNGTTVYLQAFTDATAGDVQLHEMRWFGHGAKPSILVDFPDCP